MDNDTWLMILSGITGIVFGLILIVIVTLINHKIAQKRYKKFREGWDWNKP